MNALCSLVRKRSVFFGALTVLVAATVWYALYPAQPIVDFEYARDAQEVHALFKRDWYWLVAASEQEYDVDFVLRYKARSHDRASMGGLTIKVLRECGEFKGFTAYHKKNNTVGFLLFLSVKEDARRKGYGETLARYAINDLLSQGCTKIELVTRPSNERALGLYTKRLGFTENSRDAEFVYLQYVPTEKR